MKYYILCFLFLQVSLASAQEITARVVDFETREPIPYATIQFGENRGIVSNDEGMFTLPEGLAENSEIAISFLGYETARIEIEEITKEISLKQNSIELSDVFLSDKNLSGREIAERVLISVDNNYNFDLSKKRFFLRRSYFNMVNNFDLEVEKSTVEELDQEFMDELVSRIPHYVDSYNEYLGDFYGNSARHKVRLIKAAKLDNPVNDESLDELTNRMEKILQERVGEGSFLKIRSGIVGVKVSSEEIHEDIEQSKVVEKPKEKSPEEKLKAETKRKKQVQESASGAVNKQLQNMFWKEDKTFDVFENLRKYEFTVEGYAQLEDSYVYIVAFEPKRKADFKGKMYVNTTDFGIHRLDYENVRLLKKFRLFGISTEDDIYRGTMIFNRGTDGKYNPRYLEVEDGTTVGIDRPLKIMVKKGKFTFKKKLDELDLEMRINNSSISKNQLVIYEDSPLGENEFEGLEISNDFEYRVFKKYNPDFWSGYNIIEPNAAIKAFISLEENSAL